LAVEFWSDQKTIATQWNVDKAFTPSMDVEKREKLYAGWKKAVKKAMKWELEE
jgi:glycerol kinase